MASERITVLHLVNHLQWGGVRRHVLDLKEGCEPHGVRSLVAAALPVGDALRGDPDVRHLPLYTGYSYRKSPAGMFRGLRVLRDVIDREGVRVLHMHSRYATLLGALAAGRRPLRFLYTAHNMFVDLRWLPWYPQDVIAPTAAVAEHFLATVRNPRRFHVQVIPHGVPVPAMVSEPAAPPRFCFVGRLCEEKGVRVLAEALRLLGREADSFPAIDIVGDGPLRSWLSETLQASVPPRKVRLHGYHENPAEVLRGATALLFPSIALDAAGYAVLEAMALGVPVIASDLAILRELVLPERSGLLVPARDAVALADAIALAAREREGMRRLGHAARQLVADRHERERMCADTAAVYRQLAESM